MEVAGVQRVRSRDLATGIVLGAATGLAALFLYLDTTTSATTGAAQQILFGSIFTVESSTIPVVTVLGALVLIALGAIHRPLLLSSLSPDLASARGIRVRLVGLIFMLTMAVAVGLSSIAIGSILSTALLIGPAATALRVTRSLRHSVIAAGVLGVATTLLGIVLAYDSSYWEPSTQGLPVSFFIVAITFGGYLVSGLPFIRRSVGSRSRHGDDRGRGRLQLATDGPQGSA
jgi:zinc/manganese transport system permease protein